MKQYSSSLLVLVLAIFTMAPGWAQAHSKGFYLSSDIGLNVASGIDTNGYSNDRASVCDEYINPMYDQVESSMARDSLGNAYSDYNCTGPDRGSDDDWQNSFDSATGILAGAAVGYNFGKGHPNSPLSGFRIELEYFYRQSKYNQTSSVVGASGESQDKLNQEVVQADERIGNMDSHNIFANAYYDFANTSRFTPYIGIGGGIGITDMEYGSVWARASDAANISTGSGLPNAEMIQQNLAGTASVVDTTLSDTLYGLQVLFGVDYKMTEAMSLGLKGRWVRFDSFDSGQGSLVWNPLRGHPPNLRRDGSEPVAAGIETTNNIQFFGISLNMKYHF
ncbi:MAG: hypothetical protein F4201_09440 [Nitrospira sp. SB0677_bin_15]|nr:hypothetical protein [Nitrospira sp. SB0661_bin_20]MYG41014.1 hypothetical protein [Nitrospira sp. SB0677_bin_15]MYJ23929.1 hypothetical protein [Nitrospira sp. SB0673_bin_12]